MDMLAIAFQWIGIFFIILEILYIIAQRPSVYQIILLCCLASLLVWYFGYLVELTELHNGNLENAIIGTQISYIGKPFVLLCMFFFLVRYANISLPKWFTVFLIVFDFIISFSAFTSSYQPLFYSSIGYDAANNSLLLGHGPLYHAFTASTVAFFLFNFYILFRLLKTVRNKSDIIRILLVFALMFSGLSGFAIFLTGVTNGYDTTLLGCFFSSCFLLILFLKYRLFDSLTLAKERILDDLDGAFIVVNAHNQIEYANIKAKSLFPDIFSEKENDNILNHISEIAENNDYYFDEQSVYDIECHDVIERGIFYGKVFEFIDITERYIYTNRLQEEVEIKTQNIKDIQNNVTESFAALVEARDDVTGTHIKNTSSYVRALATELVARDICDNAKDMDYVLMLSRVAPLHDIGKISIPDNILNKPGKLTDEEFDVIKTHTVKGSDIINETFHGVESDDYVKMAHEVAKYHHERWDGTGYPLGLKENEIPLSAQIMSICDVYDALRSKRPYKDAFPKEKSLEIIRSERGKQFNPDIVDAFLAISDRLE